MVKKIISGGQTGVDRAALDVAIELGIPYGGWIPKGRRAEDGPLPALYRMQESSRKNYAVRTALNVRDSDVTLILSLGPLSGGSALTESMANRYQKSYLHVDLAGVTHEVARERVLAWLAEQSPQVVNIAGPRESTCPGIYRQARTFIRSVLDFGELHH